jgi:hypothetical protein
VSSPIQRALAHTRSYGRTGPHPTCPEHELELTPTLGYWRCPWRTVELRESSTGFYEHVIRCSYKHGDRREVEVEVHFEEEA